jgi:ADP-ribose pyrophosphatase
LINQASNQPAVVILPILVSQDEVKTILITQFRPPVSTYTVELPAGLIDENETAEEAAIRELKEETGYVADSERCVSLGGILANFAEMTRDTMRFVVGLSSGEFGRWLLG